MSTLPKIFPNTADYLNSVFLPEMPSHPNHGEKDVLEKGDAHPTTTETSSATSTSDEEAVVPRALDTRSAFVAWLLLSYSTGPTSGVAATYVTASIQSMANLLGHVPGSDRACARRGTIVCVVRFGSGEVDYNTYNLYLQAIARAIEGVVTILVTGIADYSHYRKTFMLFAIFVFGTLALPFAGLTNTTYAVLVVTSVLYCLLTTFQGVYGALEASYIPLFMRSVGWQRTAVRLEGAGVLAPPPETEAAKEKRFFVKGARVSVLGLIASNLGSITALLIGIIITYTRGNATITGYFNFLLAITIAGCLTIVIAAVGGFLLPSVPGKVRPETNIFILPIKRFFILLRSIRKYPEAFKLCVGWILWNTAYSNFNSVISLLFREVTGLGSGDGLFTVWTFTAILLASCGSLLWMFILPYFHFPIKRWAYGFLAVNILCVVWGCIGISTNVSIGYKQTAEFWVEQAIFLSTSSALRSHNRVLYSSMLPRGAEAQFFGLEITLDLATGWINPLIQGTIQNRTHNLRFPMIPNLVLMLISAALYIWTDVEKGIREAEVPMEE